MTNLEWLENWFSEVCDGSWEHDNGIIIETIDNPGWRVEISLEDTPWEKLSCPDRTIDCGEDNWVHIIKKQGRIVAASSCLNLDLVIGIIREWIEDNKEVN